MREGSVLLGSGRRCLADHHQLGANMLSTARMATLSFILDALDHLLMRGVTPTCTLLQGSSVLALVGVSGCTCSISYPSDLHSADLLRFL